MEEGQIPREVLGNSQRRIETARAYYLAEHQDEPVGKIQNVAVTTLEKFRSGVRKRRNLAPRSLPENDVRFIDPAVLLCQRLRLYDGMAACYALGKFADVLQTETRYSHTG